ncbi:hypothetical protein SETIT_7G039000v2 [Setaria italica]|uniref:F-box domain-containing protein n=1 Tax=Setaria italica TaxID=4555 RepID=K3YDT5_SETIT|nr:hypothetical protein SETIT_7G039000v2 [Setaria italica]
MANFTPPFPLDRDARRRGEDPQEMEALFGRVLSYIYHALPDPPVTADGDLCILFDDDGGGIDRLSLLPDTLLGNIVSRLPIKDAARTAVLSRRWRPIWRATPLVLLDTHLLPGGDDVIPNHLDRASSSAVVAAVSRILDAHPGPFCCVRLTCCYMDEHRAPFARWLKLFAVKGVKELFLINRPWPLEAKTPIPATLFSMAELNTLYLGFWMFPDTTGLLRGAAFPRLRELGLCSVYIDAWDIEFVLSRSPVLEILSFEGLFLPLRLRLVSNSLRCLQVHSCKLDSLTVVDAPRLERLFLRTYESEGLKNRIKIAHAPALLLFGNFELGKDELQIGRTIVKARTGADPSATITSVKTLDVDVRFGIRSDAKMLLIILRCFPNLERLHIHSKNTTESTGRLNIKFWQESGAIKCVLSRIAVMAFHDFRGERNEIAFLKFVIESAPMLRMLMIVYANGYFGSRDEATSKTKALFAGKRANDHCLLAVCENMQADGGLWNFQKGSDFSCRDPFGIVQCSSFGVGHWYV